MAYIDAFSALGDPTRRRIFESLRGHPRSVNEVASTQTVSRPAVSQHLKILEQAKLVYVLPQGTKRVYSIRREAIEELRQYVESFWSDVLEAFAAEANKDGKIC